MATARFAAVVIAFLSLELFAQHAPQGIVTIQVTDATGAVIPGARIEIDPSSPGPGRVLKADSEGQAVLDLSPGVYALSVAGLGFKNWTRQIDMRSGLSQLIAAKLDVASTGEPGRVFDWAPYQFSPISPEPILLALQPLLNLDPLPLRHAKRRW